MAKLSLGHSLKKVVSSVSLGSCICVRAEEIDSLSILTLCIKLFDVWVESVYMIAAESPEGFSAAGIPCNLLSSDFISAAIHFEVERCRVGTVSDKHADIRYTLN